MFHEQQQIGGYTLISILGRGGFGEVWLAERRTEILTTLVAIKLPHKEQINLEAIRQEAALWAKASGHANVLPIIEANIYDGQIVIVSEYAPDGSLAEKLEQSKEYPIKEKIETAIGILNGLDFLHARHIIHRDIKPANILLQGDTPRLADFGISRVINATAVSTTIVGTPRYMAPEAFDGKRTVETDIWSVGVILYQMLSGDVPFAQQNPTELMWAIVSKDPAPFPNPVPPDLQRIVHKALAKLPENRFQTAREMREELQKAWLDLAHPTSTKPEDLEKPLPPVIDDNQTIVPKLITSDKPVDPVPPTEVQIITKPIQPIGQQFFNRPTDKNERLQIGQTDFNLVPPTLPSLKMDADAINSPAIADLPAPGKWTIRRIICWVFYFLAPVIGLLIAQAINPFDHGWQATLIISGFGIVFGCIFPEGKRQWGWPLNLYIMFVVIYRVIGGNYPIDALAFPLVLAAVTSAASYLGAWLAEKINPSPESKPQQPDIAAENEWTTNRTAWIFYFLTPPIGFLASWIISAAAFSITHKLIPSLLIETPLKIVILIEIPLKLIFFGVSAAVLGYVFPQEKWRWGLWLNIINLIVIMIFIINLYLFDAYYYRPVELKIFQFIEFLLVFGIPFITSYLGSRLALQRKSKSG